MYDIRLFFRFLIQSNPYFKNKDIKEIQLQDLEKLQAVDIEEYLEYLKLYVDDEGKHIQTRNRDYIENWPHYEVFMPITINGN